ncbi:MAG: hypothetical protein P8M25_21165 [Paracoccaceae bacterium]|nr:hypothetical protein [Paracoccaceae bacterium]
MPSFTGFEGVGTVEGVGVGVNNFPMGCRVSEIRKYPTDILLQMPKNMDDKIVAALLMKGMTAHYLLHRTYAVQPGDMILVHAAAGGMGLSFCQWAKALGAHDNRHRQYS